MRHAKGASNDAVAIDARDIPAAWRRAEREARGESFALYDPDGGLIRVGVSPPTAIAAMSAATAIALAPDGELVLSGHDDGSVRARDPGTGQLRWERSAGESRVECILLPARAPWVVACTRTGEVAVLHRADGRTLVKISDTEARAVAIAPDDRAIALAGSVVRVWSLPEGHCVQTLDADVALEVRAARDAVRSSRHGDEDDDDEPADEGIYLVAFAATGSTVIGARDRGQGELVLWDRANGTRVATRAMFPVDRFAATRSGTCLLVGVRDDGSTVRRLDTTSLATQSTYRTGAEALWDLRIAPDDRFALAHDDETGLYVMDLADGATHTCLDEFEACAYAIRRPRATVRERRAREDAAERDTQVVAVPRWRRGEPGTPLSGDGTRYAAVRRNHDAGTVALFDLDRRAPYAALSHQHPVRSVWLDHDGSHAATRDARGNVFVWTIPNAPATLR